LVTLEDVIEEIVGEIDDEHDQEEEELQIIDEDTVVVDAKIDVEEVAAHFKIELPDGPYESVGGLILHRLGRLPQSGDAITIDTLEYQVLSADRRRIRSLQIRYIR
jgi:CBS domain containing-hemolysin-like protein